MSANRTYIRLNKATQTAKLYFYLNAEAERSWSEALGTAPIPQKNFGFTNLTGNENRYDVECSIESVGKVIDHFLQKNIISSTIADDMRRSLNSALIGPIASASL